MCFRTKLNAKIIDIEKAFEAKFVTPELYRPQQEINAFDFSANPVITNHAPGEILFYHWGLLPFWAKNDSLKKSTLNARIETLTEKPAFKNSVANRCLVIANGYYEWQWLDDKGRKKQKYLITVPKEEIFAFAGIYSTWKDPSSGINVDTYTIVTTRANALMSEIHNNKQRMPVVLSHRDRQAWLDNQPVENFAYPYEVALEAQKI